MLRGSVLKPPAGIAVLKRSVQPAGFSPEPHFLNMSLAGHPGLEFMNAIKAERIAR